jgi:hypothetical protein
MRERERLKVVGIGSRDREMRRKKRKWKREWDSGRAAG